MTVEYILLMALFAFFVMGALINNPKRSFENAGPLLGARVEKHLTTGDGFGSRRGNGTAPLQWE